MKNYLTLLIFLTLLLTLTAQAQSNAALSAQLLQRDSILFHGVFNCNFSEAQSIYAPEFSYEQDGGDMKSVSAIGLGEFMERIKQRCSRGGLEVRRSVSEASAAPMGADGAVQHGIQQFYVIMPGQPEQLVETTRFSRTWKKINGEWKMTSELDYPAAVPQQPSSLPPSPGVQHQQSPLYKSVAALDKQVFDAYNSRDLDKFVSFFSKDLEFYHDRGGLTNYQQNVVLFKNDFLSDHKMRRELVAGTLEVYPVGEYGALEIGIHRFYGTVNGQEQLEATAKFAQIWKNENGKWIITREISYDHQ